MDRREFVALSAMAGGTLAIEPSTAAQNANEQPQSGPDPATAWSSDGTIDVRITSELMEDYTSGRPFVPASALWSRSHVPYVSRDGAEQMYCYARAGTDPSVTRVYPEPAGITGWASVETKLPPDGPGDSPALNRFPSPILIVPGSGATPDRLIVSRFYSTQVADLAADGTIGTFTTMNRWQGGALTCGNLPTGTLYMPEMNRDARPYQWVLRRTSAPYDEIPVEGQPIPPLGLYIWGGQQIFPLKGSTRQTYRCILVEPAGTIGPAGAVSSLHLQLDESNPASPIFRVAQFQPLAHTSNGCVYVNEHQTGQVEVLVFELPQIVTVKGSYDPAKADSVTWSAPATPTLPGTFSLDMAAAADAWNRSLMTANGGQLYALGGWNGLGKTMEVLFLSLQPNGSFNVWTTARKPDGSWDEIELLDRQWQSGAVFPGDSFMLSVSKPGTGLEKWARNEDGEWNSQHLRVAHADSDMAVDESQMLKTPGYRVGINLRSKAMPLAGERLSLTTSCSSSAIVNHDYLTLGVHRPQVVTTDSTGIAWVTVLLQDRLSLPVLYVNSTHFKTQLALDLNHSIETFFVEITEEKLISATDPTGKKLLAHPENAKDAVDNIGRALKMAPEKLAGIQPTPEHPRLVSDVPAHWMPAVFDPAVTRGAIVHDPDACWCFEVVDGVMKSRTLTRAEAQAQIRAMSAMDVFSDAADFVGNLCSSAWDGACNVARAVVSGATLTLEIVVDAVHFIYSGVIDTIDRILDVVGFVLDAAGMLLGQAIGWLLEQLGFLFDWAAIRDRRDKLKNMIASNAGLLTTSIPDPKVTTQAISDSLDTLRAQLTKARSTAPAKSSYSSVFSGMKSIAGAFEFGSDCVLPQATWMMDKVQSFLPKSDGVFGIPGEFAAAQLTLVEKMVAVSGSMTINMAGLEDTLLQWVGDGAIFGDASLQPLLDWLIDQVDAVISTLKELADEAGNALHVVWQKPDTLIGWLNKTISIRFFSAFYKGMTHNDFSLLDLVCLLAAIPDTAVDEDSRQSTAMKLAEMRRGPDYLAPVYSPNGMRARLEMANYLRPTYPMPLRSGGEAMLFAAAMGGQTSVPASDQQRARAAAIAFMSMGIFTTGLDSFTLAVGLGSSIVGDFTAGLNACMTVASTMCMVIASGDKTDLIATPAVIGAAIWIFFGVTVLRGLKIPKHLVDLLLVGAAIYFIYKAADADKGNKQLVAYHSLALTQQVMSLAVRFRVIWQQKPLPPLPQAVAYGASQASLALAKMVLYATTDA